MQGIIHSMETLIQALSGYLDDTSYEACPWVGQAWPSKRCDTCIKDESRAQKGTCRRIILVCAGAIFEVHHFGDITVRSRI